MGYTTYFNGSFKLSRPATETEMNYINKFCETRRMKRDVNKLMELFKGEFGHPTRSDNPYGMDGEFFVGAGGHAGQDMDESIVDYNTPPGQEGYSKGLDFSVRYVKNDILIKNGVCQPGLWCQWILSDNKTLEWDGGEKFYYYTEWLGYLINNFFEEWGIKLNGEVTWKGEESEDLGKIVIKNNNVQVLYGEISYR